MNEKFGILIRFFPQIFFQKFSNADLYFDKSTDPQHWKRDQFKIAKNLLTSALAGIKVRSMHTSLYFWFCRNQLYSDTIGEGRYQSCADFEVEMEVMYFCDMGPDPTSLIRIQKFSNLFFSRDIFKVIIYEIFYPDFIFFTNSIGSASSTMLLVLYVQEVLSNFIQ